MFYYKVTAKCGHVGRRQYYRGELFVKAENASHAAQIARQIPRVKHHHKDAIIDVCKIDYQQYVAGQAEYASNPYFTCQSKQEQKGFFEQLLANIFPEQEQSNTFKTRADHLEKQLRLKKAERKANKYLQFVFEA